MERFHIIEEGAVILISKGNFRQAKIYRRAGDVYAGWGSGYVKLGGAGGTSHPAVTWLDIEAEGVEINKIRRPIWAQFQAVA